jgi:hypothetical protein
MKTNNGICEHSNEYSASEKAEHFLTGGTTTGL